MYNILYQTKQLKGADMTLIDLVFWLIRFHDPSETGKSGEENHTGGHGGNPPLS
jgi:hypothetical protein